MKKKLKLQQAKKLERKPKQNSWIQLTDTKSGKILRINQSITQLEKKRSQFDDKYFKIYHLDQDYLVYLSLLNPG